MAVLRGANTVLNSTDGILVLATITPQSITTDPQTIIFQNTTLNKGTTLNTSTGIFTAQKSGYYRIIASVGISSGSPVTGGSIRIQKNSTTYISCSQLVTISSGSAIMQTSIVVQLGVGETVEVAALTLTGVSLLTDIEFTNLSIEEVLNN